MFWLLFFLAPPNRWGELLLVLFAKTILFPRHCYLRVGVNNAY